MIIKFTEDFIRERRKEESKKEKEYSMECISELRALALSYSMYQKNPTRKNPDILDCIEV